MTQRLTFLTLPVEIRLNIYSWVHADHAVQHAQLDPGYPTPPMTIYMTKSISPEPVAQLTPIQLSSDGHNPGKLSVKAEQQNLRLLHQNRPLSRIPTSLLVVNRQVYLEAKSVPFLENEFVFINWFSSGLSLANSFVAVLAPWQQELLRFARLESFTIDFQESGHEKWNHLCRLFSLGLWGLRLRIQEGKIPFISSGPGSENQVAASSMPESSWKCMVLALAEMKALRWLEIELSIVGWSKSQKTIWCKKLEECVNMTKEKVERKIQVLCVELQTSH
ncbi:hypothetical protein BGZ61DRAFT_375613 [Ilyonectria robusta]|uniref:uncharacterized protein n=1 Tax=Ilyonectria robusta TaxID=1079257 RepID=UPI001E8CE355|nr:uncharacterized protein BGZ61DRAFT_375613 [Ilyonectria robusta]KAH8650701.1 hypothetical protein BGZ61DRAFT_375613 [Ilyonectria robusta]